MRSVDSTAVIVEVESMAADSTAGTVRVATTSEDESIPAVRIPSETRVAATSEVESIPAVKTSASPAAVRVAAGCGSDADHAHHDRYHFTVLYFER